MIQLNVKSQKSTKNRYRIGFLLLANSFGGAERRYLRLARFLADYGFPVSLFCNSEVMELAQRQCLSLDGVEKVLLRRVISDSRKVGAARLFSRFTALAGWFSFFALFRHYEIKHLHVVSNPGNLVFFLAIFARLLPPFSFSIFGSRPVDLGRKIRFIEKMSIRRGAAGSVRVDCLTPSYQDFARRIVRRRDRDKILVAPCSFTDYESVRFSEDRDIDVLFLGRFVEGKGLRLLREIWPVLEAEGISLHVCGAGPLQSLAPGPNVYETTNPFDVLSRATIFLSIQEGENYPSQSLLEAMGSQCAVVATDVGNTRLLLDESVSILISPEPLQLLDAIKFLLGNPEIAENLGRNARQKVITEFTLERFARYFREGILGVQN